MSSLATILVMANMPSRASTMSEASPSLFAHARAVFPTSDIQVRLKHHYKTKTYTSSSPIEGEVTITTRRDVRFDSIEIVLLGSSRTRTEGYSAPNESTHTFLKLVMPIPESSYPVLRVLETGRTLTLPFNFVLPSFLTLNACHHKLESDHVRDQHLRLPPSMGSWARGNWEKDDLAPHMAEVDYSIKARIWREPELRGRLPVKVMEAVKSIQVLPAFAEDAPLSIAKNDALYKMSKTKTLRKNIISSKLGRLTVYGQQPRAIMLHPDGRVAAGSVAQLDLSFEPVSSDVPPPKITGVSAKVSAHTYYSAGPINRFPNTGDWMSVGIAERRGVYSTSVNLQSQPPEIRSWRPDDNRRDSGYVSETAPEKPRSSEDDYCDEPQQQKPHRRRSSAMSLANIMMRPTRRTSSSSASTRGRARRPSPASSVVHTTSLHVPVDLPTARKTFVPTFHSCILSRVYTLHVSLAVAGASPGPAATVSLDLPLQIAVEAVAPAAGGEELPSWEDAVEDAAVDEFLRPRVLGVREVDLREETTALPGYARR